MAALAGQQTRRKLFLSRILEVVELHFVRFADCAILATSGLSVMPLPARDDTILWPGKFETLCAVAGFARIQQKSEPS